VGMSQQSREVDGTKDKAYLWEALRISNSVVPIGSGALLLEELGYLYSAIHTGHQWSRAKSPLCNLSIHTPVGTCFLKT